MRRAIGIALLGLAACTDPHEPIAPDFGNSVRANIAAQVVNPEPAVGLADSDGRRIENAIRRYETNRVYVPRTESGTPLDNSMPATPPPAPPPTPTQ